MLAKGANVDIATGRPMEELLADKGDLKSREEESALKRKAVYAGIIDTDPGQMIVGLIVGRLKDRMRTLAEHDPEAGALVGLLKEFGVKENIAEAAMEELAWRYLRKGDMGKREEA